MIILRSRSLIIPNDEYNLGNDYDTNTATRVFQLDRVMEGIDLANLMFKLDLTYADGTSDTLALDSEVTDDKINLTWTVTKNQLHVPGTVVVQIRALNVDGNMKWTSYIGAFFVEASMFGSADYNGKLSEVEQFEVAIKSEKERVQNEKVRQDAEAERVQAEAERKSSEEERETAEAERKSAETVRSKAETARESAETEREEWYNSAKTNFDAAIASGDKAERIANSLETNVEANMKAAAASATAAAGSASAAAGSANEAKEYSQNWSALDQKVTKNANDIAATNNNLSNRFKVEIITDLNQITKTGWYSGGNIAQIKQYIPGGWNIINATVQDDKSARISVFNKQGLVLEVNRDSDNSYTYFPLALKSDLNAVLMYRGVITGDLNRGRNLVIAPGIYSIQSVSTITNGPSDFGGWGIFVQFPDNLFSQMILNSPNYIKFRKYSGSDPSWGAW